ncbi:hypothetical protein MKX01_029811 [Papaver californicum]|nr:hypothetical protein MKX01_029811 [Papaver californicum]
MCDVLHRADNCIKVAINRLKVQLSEEAHLEELVAKNAKKKSDVAREALLAELELEPKKRIHKGGHSKHNQEKLKDKKNKRDPRKAKSFKLEAEERKLEEILEYQRRIENEGKQKHLAVNGKAPDNCFVPSEGWIGRQRKQHNSFTSVVKGSSRSLNSENDNRKLGVFKMKALSKTFRVSQGGTIFGSINGMEYLGTRFKTEAGKYDCLLPQMTSSESDGFTVSQGEIIFDSKSGTEVLGTGLKNEAGEYICFLNVIIQSLWHLKRFRGDMASTDKQIEAVAPTSLGVALSNLYPDGNFLQQAQMNDASEVMAVIFDCLHKSFTSNCNGSWDCESKACVAHSLFGMDIFEKMHCYSCGLESKHLKYTSFFHNINASALRTAKNTHECANDISATLAALTTELDFAVLYRGLLPGRKHRLACYYGQHYGCFAYSREQDRWTMYDDETVKVICGWDDVIVTCERAHLQPHILFFEAVD